MDRGLTMIKVIVIGLGIAIVAVTVMIVVAAIDKAGEVAIGSPEPAAETADFADVAVALPAGARVVAMSGEGDALSLLLQLPGGAQSVMTVDRRSGEVLGTLELLPRSE